MYFSPDGKSAIVVAEAYKRLDFRDPKTMALQYSISRPGCSGINHADFSIDGRFALFTCEFEGRLAKIDLVERKVLGYLKLSDAGHAIQGDRGPRAPSPARCGTQQSEVCTTRGMPQDIRVSPDGKRFYVADMMADGVFVIDGETFKEIGFIKTGKGTHGLYPSRDGKKLYVANRGSQQDPRPPSGPGSVSVLDFATDKVEAHVAGPRRRQPRHGQRQRRRQAALAVGPLRRRRLCDRHDSPARSTRSRSAREPQKKKSGSNSRRNSPLGRPPRNMASSTSMFQFISVRIARSCAGALRAVTSAVRMRIAALPACCSRCSAASSGLKGPSGSGSVGLAGLVALEGVQPFVLEHPLGLVGEQHGVAVEGDAHFVRIVAAGLDRFRQHARRGKTRRQRLAHVLCVGRQEQVGAQRPQVAKGRPALREHAALQLDAVGRARAEDAHARHRVVAREDHHLHALRRRRR